MRSVLGTLLNKAPVPYVGRSQGLAVAGRTQSNETAQMAAMGSVGTLFAIVTALANNTSRVDWKLYRKSRSGRPEDRVEVTAHAALDVWNKPNPFMPRQEFVESVQQHIDLTGEGWWVISRNPASPLPLELWPVRPDRIAPVPDPVKFIKGYIYTDPDGKPIPLATTDVIFLRMPNPLDPYTGMGPVQSIMTELEAARYASEWNKNFFLNSSEPGGIIEVDKRLSDDEFDELRERWAEQHRGVAAAHRVALIESGMKWVERGFSQRDMQFTELRGLSSAAIREAYGMPKFAIGDVDDVNRATAEASRAWFGESMLVPRLERFKGALNGDFLPLYGPGADVLEFDYENPVPTSSEIEQAELAAKTQAAKTLIDAGFEPADVLHAVGLPEIIHLSTAAAAAGTPVVTSDEEDLRGLTEMIQKIYLGVGPVVTWDEARSILAAAGAPLDLSLPPPAPAGLPVAPPAGAEPAEEAPAPEPVPSRRAPAAALLELDPAPTMAEVMRSALRNAADAGEPEVEEAGAEETREDWEDRTAALVAAWTAQVTAQQVDDLVRQVEGVVGSGQPAGLADLGTDGSPGVALLTAAMVEQATAAAHRMVEVAAEQGQEISAAVPGEPGEGEELAVGLAEDLAAAAAIATKKLTDGFVSSAAGEALRAWAPGATGEEVGGAVRDHLESLTTKTLETDLSASVWAAENEGRSATLELAEVVGLGAFYFLADEVRDKATCQACKAVDGKRFNSLAEAQAAYPFGGYRDCAGRSRCRGTWVPKWGFA